jgi:hypothetical protein
MQRSVWHRLIAAALGLWLLLVSSEPAALHTCVQHDGMHGVHGGDSTLRSPPHHGSRSHQAPAKHQHGCTCIGACCVSLAAVLTPHADVVVATRTSSPARLIVSSASSYRPSAVEHARPPTVGPPILAV